MRSPGFYSHHPPTVETIETHISWVFLAGDRVYKLRKAVVFPFLDYGTAERRRALCEEEVRLGRRLAPTIYRGVCSVVQRAKGLELAVADAEGAIEHVTEMVRFDEGRTLAALIERGEVSEEHVASLARRLAAFHATAEAAPSGTFDAAAVMSTIGENFSTLLPHTETVDAQRLTAAHLSAVAFVHRRRELLDARPVTGHVRHGHGDMRAEHVIFGEEIEIFDPVEFDPALRYIDVLADVAFLVMDLSASGREDLAELLIREYQAVAGEHDVDQLLWFYAAYRAWVRAKVACLRAGELESGHEQDAQMEEARKLGELGSKMAWRCRRPLLLVVCGGSATGKTFLARALAEASGLAHLNSDVVRKELAGLGPTIRAPERDYSEEASRRTYRELGVRAATQPNGAIVDATFRHRDHRAVFLKACQVRGLTPLFVECRAPAATVVDRARSRALDTERASDATPELAARMLHEFEPLDEIAPDAHIALRTDRPLQTMIDDVEGELDARLFRPSIR